MENQKIEIEDLKRLDIQDGDIILQRVKKTDSQYDISVSWDMVGEKTRKNFVVLLVEDFDDLRVLRKV